MHTVVTLVVMLLNLSAVNKVRFILRKRVPYVSSQTVPEKRVNVFVVIRITVYYTTLHYIILHYAKLYHTLLYYTTLYTTIPYYTTLYYTTLYYTIHVHSTHLPLISELYPSVGRAVKVSSTLCVCVASKSSSLLKYSVV
jgi:hypothetical protein